MITNANRLRPLIATGGISVVSICAFVSGIRMNHIEEYDPASESGLNDSQKGDPRSA